MLAKQIPNAEQFVVNLSSDSKEEVFKRLESLGSIEDLGQANLLLLRVNQSSSRPHEDWKRLSQLVGSNGVVQPVLLDETGHPHYPTGEVTARFLKKLSDKELHQFATKYGLRLRDRNEFVPEQATFQLADPAGTYLPKLLQELSEDKRVKNSWANTLSYYKRY
jgi:hypothetical protein